VTSIRDRADLCATRDPAFIRCEAEPNRTTIKRIARTEATRLLPGLRRVRERHGDPGHAALDAQAVGGCRQGLAPLYSWPEGDGPWFLLLEGDLVRPCIALAEVPEMMATPASRASMLLVIAPVMATPIPIRVFAIRMSRCQRFPPSLAKPSASSASTPTMRASCSALAARASACESRDRLW
jgi:hypothetical protein